jgi:peptide/nickel transport system permease protein
MTASTSTGSRVTSVTTSGRRRTWRDLPVVHQLRQSVGVQRGMLVAGLVLTGVFVLVALLAPVIAPYRWAQREAGGRAFDTLRPPETICSAPRRAATTCCRGCSGVRRPRWRR